MSLMPFIDLRQQYQAYKSDIDQRIQEVLAGSQFILGPQVAELETTLADYVGVPEAVGVSSGTDALLIALMALGLAPGDEVITTPFTFIATVEVLLFLGIRPVFVDIDPLTCNLDPERIPTAITPRTRAIIPVSLYGLMPDMERINGIAEASGLAVIEDAAQSFGAAMPGGRSCGMSSIACTSFFPAKPFGCYGDGGMIFTRDRELAQVMREIRVHGQARRYVHDRLGLNGRLDTLQAAVLLAKFPHFEDEVRRRGEAGRYYLEGLKSTPEVTTLAAPSGYTHVYGQFTVRLADRDKVAAALQEDGIPTAIHYPVPLHRQPVLAAAAYRDGDFPHAERASREVLSLPMHPFLTPPEQDRVLEALRKACSA